MLKEVKLSPERVITSCYEKLEGIFQDKKIKNFEKEISLTPVLEYGRTKEEFYCNGFIFRTERSIEIIFTARRVISDNVGIDYGLRWCASDTTEELDSLKLDDYLCFKNERRWVLAKPYQSHLLVLGKTIPENFRKESKNGGKIYSTDLIQYLIVEILADKIIRG